MLLTYKDKLVILIVTTLILAGSLIGWMMFGEVILVLSIGISTGCLLAVALEVFRRHNAYLQGVIRVQQEIVRTTCDNALRQMEALLAIYSAIQPAFPLPHTRGWAASPDLLKKIMETIFLEKPQLVVELGGGASSIIIAYCLKQIGAGRLVTLDHDHKYAELCRRQIAAHGLDDIATIILAPLKKRDINGQTWLWYDCDGMQIDKPIDLLVVDGPPVATQSMARYPALPLLLPKLSPSVTIIMDDGVRDDEKQVIERWKEEIEGLTCTYYNLEKGAFLIKLNEHSG